MTESIQFRGPMELEGPDDLDDDDNYMRPGLETTGLQNRKQKDQPTKKSLYFAVICFFAGLFYFYSTYESPISVQTEFATKTTFGCDRSQYWTRNGCVSKPSECHLNVENSEQCVVCREDYYLSLTGNCIEDCEEQNGQFCTSKNNILVSNMFKPRNSQHSEFEIPYVLIHHPDSTEIFYVSDVELFQLEPFLSLNQTIIKFEDYFLLNNQEYHDAFKDFQNFTENTLLRMKSINKTYVAFKEKSQGLLYYLTSQKVKERVVLVQPTILEESKFYKQKYEIQQFNSLLANRTQVSVIYTETLPEEIQCKKKLRLMAESENQDQQNNNKQIQSEGVDCFLVEESEIYEKIVHSD